MRDRNLFHIDDIETDLLSDHGVEIGVVENGSILSLHRMDGSDGMILPPSITFRSILRACSKPAGGFDNSGEAL